MADPKIRIRATDETGPAFRTANANLAAMQASADRTSVAVRAIGSSLVAAASVTAVAALLKSVVDGIDKFNDLADATGSSIENLSALERVGSLTGTTFDTIGAALTKFNLALTNAKPGSDTEAAFKALGLSIGELKAADPSEALRRTSVALAGFASDGNKARVVQQLFGESVKNVAAFLKNLAESGTLVATVTGKQAAEAERFNRQLALMSTYSRDAARTIGSPLIEIFNNVAASIQKASREQTGWFASMDSLRRQAAARSDALFTGSWSDARGGRGFVNPPFVLPSLPDSVGAKKDPTKVITQIARDIDLANTSYRSYFESLETTLDRLDNVTEAERALSFLRRKGVGVSIDEAARLVSLAKQIDTEKALTAATEERIRVGRDAAIAAGERVAEANREYQDRLKSLTEGAASNVFKRQQEDLQFLQQALEKGAISVQVYGESVKNLFNIIDESAVKSKSPGRGAGPVVHIGLRGCHRRRQGPLRCAQGPGAGHTAHRQPQTSHRAAGRRHHGHVQGRQFGRRHRRRAVQRVQQHLWRVSRCWWRCEPRHGLRGRRRWAGAVHAQEWRANRPE